MDQADDSPTMYSTSPLGPPNVMLTGYCGTQMVPAVVPSRRKIWTPDFVAT